MSHGQQRIYTCRTGCAGDWLLVDPSARRWPRRGSIVVFLEPETELIAIKRVAALDVPTPYSPPLEEYYLPNRDKVIAAARELLAY